MRFVSLLLTLLLYNSACEVLAQKYRLDTLYYDKEWKGISTKEFASYYRVIDPKQKGTQRKPFRDYYITGELQSEGGYISIDKHDDSKSVFDGPYTNYYKTGKLELKGTWLNGVQTGEYTAFYENGLIRLHTQFLDGKEHGIRSEFSEDGVHCSQIEMEFGDPKNDYYIVSNKDGYSSKLSLKGDLILERPKIDDLRTDYKDGVAWSYYTKNGLLLAATSSTINDYGRWYRIDFYIANNGLQSVDFNPDNITSSLVNNRDEDVYLDVYSADRYISKVRGQQNFALVMSALGEGLAAMNAGYTRSSTTTSSSYAGSSSSYNTASAFGSGGYAFGSSSGFGSYSGSSSTTSTTTSYDGLAAYQASVIASNRIANYESNLMQERAVKQEGYLKRNILHPGEAIRGYIHIKRKKGKLLNVYVGIHGISYDFIWDVSN